MPIKVTEEATWAGVRDHDHAYGFAAIDVDPGTEDGQTSITVTFYDTAPSTTGVPTVFERFKLVRPRRSGTREAAAAAGAARRS